MNFNIIIPVRYASTRLPGKPLAKLAGKPLIQHVHERACQTGAEKIIIATDDFMVRDACGQFGAKVIMTARKHASGTDRIAEAVAHLNWPDDTIVVNLQGDEPLMPPELPLQVAQLLENDPQADMATLCSPITDVNDIDNANCVKVVFDKQGNALYFSRASIPHVRDADNTQQAITYRHLGLYAYRTGALKTFSQSPACELEQAEKLEQLRALWLGMRIKIAIAEKEPGRGVDTQEDLQAVEAILRKS
ncbi:MAG TPA: 3-deoxy-manno-octulosonate cytidylyltransferase [Gammaproteobacteria bacterium]|nr:3-deoxy-manno-octulosonate cytidylyltransferase [Gammaproteobacteria bacterium]